MSVQSEVSVKLENEPVSTSKRITKKFCAVFGCFNTGANQPHLSFFSLPSEDDRRFKWLELISREDLHDKNPHSYVVCEEHFDPRSIVGSSERKRLAKYALPSLYLPAKEVEAKETQTELKETAQKFIQTDFYTLRMTSGSQTPNYLIAAIPSVQKMKDELTSFKKRAKSAESGYLTKKTFNKLCDKFLTKPLAEIVKAQTKLKHNDPGNRYSTKYKQFCINLFYTSPQAYKLLAQALCLPNVKTLTRHLLPMSTEVNEHLLATLKVKVNNMSNSEKVCSVVVNSISLKAGLYYNISLDKIFGLEEVNGVQTAILANMALVVIIRGLFGNWKQPIGFALLGEFKNREEISNWIEQLLEKLFDVGLDIRTLVSDLESNLLSDEKRSAMSTDKPYFFINNRKIYYIIDALHLIKSLRNHLMSHDFHFHGAIAKYEHILQFYENEKHKTLKLAPKLTDSHVQPNKFEKLKVGYAVELLSHTVATAISCYVDFQAIHESAKDTVKLIKLMNDLLDVLNSSTIHSICEYRKAFTGSVTQVTFLNKMILFFKTLKLVDSATGCDVTETVKFITGFQSTIGSILLLFDDLRLEGYTNLLTRRLNQDVRDIMFFNHQQTKKKKPTIRQFMIAFKRFFFSNIIKSGKEGKGANDLSELLVNTKKLETLMGTESLEGNMLGAEDDCNEINQESNAAPISTSDYIKLELPELNQLRYISSYVLKKCMDVHGDCPLLKSYMEPDDKNKIVKMDIDGSDNGNLLHLQYLPDDFLIFVEEMEKHYQIFFNNYHISFKVAKSIFDTMNLIAYEPPCTCFPITYCKKLFIRIRIYITVKNNNEDFKKHRSGKIKVFRSDLMNP